MTSTWPEAEWNAPVWESRSMTPNTNTIPDDTLLIEEAITTKFGERCPDFDPDCHCCRVWRALDDLRAERAGHRKAINDAVMAERERCARIADDEAAGRDWQRAEANAHNAKREARDFETMKIEAVHIASAIRRCREDEDEAKQDTKDVYAELAAEGYEKAIVGQVVTFLRKREKDGDKVAEQSAKFDLYLEAYERPSHAHTREERSDTGLSILTKHEDIRTAPVTAEEACRASEEAAPVAGRPAEPANSLPTEGCGYAHTEGNATQSGVTAGETATNSEKAAVATQAEATAPTSDERVSLPVNDRSDAAANTGGDHVDGNALRVPTSNTGEGAANTALPASEPFVEDVPQMPMKRLHYAHCFPELTKAEYGRLEFSIIGIGVSKPIVRMGDVIVDGWARYNICRTLGISYPIKNYSGNDVLLDVIEWQRAARNFTPAQEKKIAADLAKEIPHRADDIMAAFGLVEALEAAE